MQRLTDRQQQYLRWGLWIVAILVLYFSLNWLMSLALDALRANPNVWAFYKDVEYEISSRSLLGLFIACVLGSTFLVAIPVEAAFLYYLGLDYPLFKVFSIALAGILVGTSINYGAGWLIGPRPVKLIIKEQYGTFHRKVEKAGAFLIIIANTLPPFPSDLLSLFVGTVRYGYFKVILYSAIGRIIEFFFLWLGYKYVVLYIGPYVSTLSLDWFTRLITGSF